MAAGNNANCNGAVSVNLKLPNNNLSY